MKDAENFHQHQSASGICGAFSSKGNSKVPGAAKWLGEMPFIHFINGSTVFRRKGKQVTIVFINGSIKVHASRLPNHAPVHLVWDSALSSLGQSKPLRSWLQNQAPVHLVWASVLSSRTHSDISNLVANRSNQEDWIWWKPGLQT